MINHMTATGAWTELMGNIRTAGHIIAGDTEDAVAACDDGSLHPEVRRLVDRGLRSESVRSWLLLGVH